MSKRQDGVEVDEALTVRNKKQMIITIAVVAVIFALLVTGVLLRYFWTK